MADPSAKTVACVGIAVLDLVFTVDEIPHVPGKHFATGFREVGGGVAANAAVTVAALGGRARYVGRVGADSVGERIVAELQEWKVDTSRVRRVAGRASSVSAVFVDTAGARLIVNHADPGLFEGETVEAVDVAGADAVLADLRWPRGAAAALRAGAAQGIPGILDYDLSPAPGTDEALSAASHVAFSEPALARLAGVTDPREGLRRIRARTGAFLAVTVGADGVYWLDADRVHHLPAFPVTPLDTLGAGDVFHGAMALALAEGSDIERAFRLAAAAAAIKCTRSGGRAGTPSRDEVEAFLAEVA
jgi:sulfofructose kinase